MAIDRLSIDDLIIGNVLGITLPHDTPNEELIDLKSPELSCTPDPTKITAHTPVVAVENLGGIAGSTATGLYNKQ
jgi:hypothetical protein